MANLSVTNNAIYPSHQYQRFLFLHSNNYHFLQIKTFINVNML